MTNGEDRRYDVAVSVRAEDLDLAIQLSGSLEGVRVFVYAERQTEIAGGDGMNTFRQTFRVDSHLNVVLYRDGWGKTPWTRIEETAIQERCLHDGWDTLLFVEIESGIAVPGWLPDHRIRFALYNHTMDELTETVRARLAVLGSQNSNPIASPRAASALTRAIQVADTAAFNRETQQLVRSADGMQQAFDYVNGVLRVLSETLDSMGERGLAVAHGGDQRHFVMRCQGVTMILNWQYYANSIDDCPLYFTIFRGVIPTPEEQQQGKISPFKPKKCEDFQYEVERAPGLGFCIRGRAGQTLDMHGAADELMGRFLDAYEAHKDTPLP